jgi:Ca-activated chloride channel family protein
VAKATRPAVDPLKYQQAHEQARADEPVGNGELLTLKLRYKQPDGETSKLIETVVTDSDRPYGKATADFKFASSVALFGMILRGSPHKGSGTIDAAEELAREGLSKDDGGYRAEFVELIELAKQLGAR